MGNETCFRYEIGGKLVPIEYPITDTRAAERETENLKRIGFNEIGYFGDGDAFGLTIYARRGGEARWFLIFCDNNGGCLIEVVGWATYIDALHYFSPIVGMGQGKSATQGLDEIRKTLQA